MPPKAIASQGRVWMFLAGIMSWRAYSSNAYSRAFSKTLAGPYWIANLFSSGNTAVCFALLIQFVVCFAVVLLFKAKKKVIN